MKQGQCKLVLLGEAAVGKTSLITRFVKEEFFPSSPSTVAAAFLSKTLNVDGNILNLGIWDTAGQERFHSLAPIYYRGADAAIVVYDITDMNSFEKAKTWIQVLKNELGDSVIIFLAGNKCDKEEARQVSTSMAKKYADMENCIFEECSAKNDINIKSIFKTLGIKLSLKMKKDTSVIPKTPINVGIVEKEESKTCCN
eukprot:TRINITY_DN183_c0_g1_i1.p1 TRINITY_DN183_c0_g1~~TRINITY_DN183_c0_g1_i1.p1  ORF type:complete len:209 (+),score=59.16 TRINITY_DN183_c0_g1_i1:36-629(+)